MPAKILYICYFGLQEPLVQTQVVPYLRELLKDGHGVSLLTFEPAVGGGESHPALRAPVSSEERSLGEREIFEQLRRQLAAEGIEWHWLRYHKRPSAPATAYDIFRGALLVGRLIREKNLDILHGRVHVPTLMGALARKFSRARPKLLFDIRGFFPEEYTDAGVWPENGILYRSAKRVERWLLKEADGFVVLTEKARNILFGAGTERKGEDETLAGVNVEAENPKSEIQNPKFDGRPVEVIPCSVNLDNFPPVNVATRAAMRKELAADGRKVIAYVGSFGGWYMTDEMLDFFSTAREHDRSTFVLILTQRDKEKVEEKLRKRGFADADFKVKTVAPADVPRFLSAADVALSFIKACYSKQSSSPTKIAEYLACGLPIIANRGVGDLDELILNNGVGVLVDDFSPESYSKALREVEALGDIRLKCRETAEREFDLEKVGGERYRRLYKRILSGI